MSYDITFRVKVEGADLWIDVGDCNANTTWNVREMIVKSTGLEWNNEANNGLCKDIIPSIIQGYCELATYPEKYKQYEAPNGWGTVEGTRRFFWDIIEAWKNLLYMDAKFAECATFWII